MYLQEIVDMICLNFVTCCKIFDDQVIVVLLKMQDYKFDVMIQKKATYYVAININNTHICVVVNAKNHTKKEKKNATQILSAMKSLKSTVMSQFQGGYH